MGDFASLVVWLFTDRARCQNVDACRVTSSGKKEGRITLKYPIASEKYESLSFSFARWKYARRFCAEYNRLIEISRGLRANRYETLTLAAPALKDKFEPRRRCTRQRRHWRLTLHSLCTSSRSFWSSQHRRRLWVPRCTGTFLSVWERFGLPDAGRER